MIGGSIISLFNAANTIHDFFKRVSSVINGDSVEYYLEQISDQLTESHLKVERLSDNILYLPDIQGIRDVTRPQQHIVRDLRDIRESLESTQQALGGNLLSSSLIWTPDKMQHAMVKNPWEVLHDIRPVNLCTQPTNPDMVPILFEYDRNAYVGWQLRGTLPMLFDCAFNEQWDLPILAQNCTSKRFPHSKEDTQLFPPPEECEIIRQKAIAGVSERTLQALLFCCQNSPDIMRYGIVPPFFEQSLRRWNLADREYPSISNLDAARREIQKRLWKSSSLFIDMEGVDDLSFLTGLVNLKDLAIIDKSRTTTYDLSYLSTLSQLEGLRIETRFTDLSPLKHLKQLRRLHLSSTQVANISFLSELDKLQRLFLGETFVRELSPLQNLSRINQLDLSSTQISDLSPIVELKNLKNLSIADTQVYDASILSRFCGLETLDLSGTAILDFFPLSKLDNLRELYLSRCQVKDLSILSSLSSLKTLDLSYAKLKDLMQLGDFKQIEDLSLEGVKINSVQKVIQQFSACQKSPTL